VLGNFFSNWIEGVVGVVALSCTCDCKCDKRAKLFSRSFLFPSQIFFCGGEKARVSSTVRIFIEKNETNKAIVL
jgi:hypothetical protein